MSEWFLLLILITGVVAVTIWNLAIRTRKLRARPFVQAWHLDLLRHVALYRKLPALLKPQLHELIQVFLASKNFEGTGGLELTEEMKLRIAAQACVLLLNRKTRVYPRLRSVVVYPGEFTVPTHVEFSPGHHLEDTEQRLGESWRTGAVVLSWRNVAEDARLGAGRNVVLHEFAHQLDVENGAADGIPDLENMRDYADWARTLRTAYKDLCQTVRAGRFSALDPYATKDEAEFFAVATEYFFEQPSVLRRAYPELYDQLRRFYRQDPQTYGAEQL